MALACYMSNPGGGVEYDMIEHKATPNKGCICFWLGFWSLVSGILMTDPRFTCGN